VPAEADEVAVDRPGDVADVERERRDGRRLRLRGNCGGEGEGGAEDEQP
jgi:hypothetical protein